MRFPNKIGIFSRKSAMAIKKSALLLAPGTRILGITQVASITKAVEILNQKVKWQFAA